MNQKAKDLAGRLGKEMSTLFKEAKDEMDKKLKAKAEATMNEILGEGPLEGPRKRLVDNLMEALLLQYRGMETKMGQKKDEAMGQWSNEEIKAMRDARKKAKEGAKSDL